MLPAAEVEAEWSGVLRTVRAGMLAVPSRAAHRLQHLTAHDVAEIDREVRDVLTEIGKLGIQMFFADVNIEMNDMQVLRSKDLISRTGINNFFQV